jgi:radial spoke head protein 9
MSLFDIEDIAQFNIAGFTLNTEEKASLTASLIHKIDDEKLSNLYLWGKIQGINRDYFLAQSSTSEDKFKRKYFYWYHCVMQS